MTGPSVLFPQVNAKLGGVNASIVGLPKMDSPTIIFGADVTHPSPGAGNFDPSIASVVCSIDAYACRQELALSHACSPGRAAVFLDMYVFIIGPLLLSRRYAGRVVKLERGAGLGKQGEEVGKQSKEEIIYNLKVRCPLPDS